MTGALSVAWRAAAALAAVAALVVFFRWQWGLAHECLDRGGRIVLIGKTPICSFDGGKP